VLKRRLRLELSPDPAAGGNWTFRGHAKSPAVDDSLKDIRGQEGLFADKLFEVIAEPLASLHEQRSLSRGQT